jgi:hypothetical protein
MTQQGPLGQTQIQSWFAQHTPATWQAVVDLNIAPGTPCADLGRALQETLRAMGPPLPPMPRPHPRGVKPEATVAEIVGILDVAGANPTGIGAYNGPGQPEKTTGAGGSIGRSIGKGWIEQYEIAPAPELPSEYTHRYRPTRTGWEQVRLIDRYREARGPRISPHVSRLGEQEPTRSPTDPAGTSSTQLTLDLSDLWGPAAPAPPAPAGCAVPHRRQPAHSAALGGGGHR